MLRMARTVQHETGMDNLCLAGGVALNCVANGRILREGPSRRLWIQPAAGDAGGALGVAQLIWHRYCKQPRSVAPGRDGMHGAYLGPAFSPAEIEAYLVSQGAPYERLERGCLLRQVAQLLADERVVGWFDGRMEFGPRALGARSILGDPRSPRMQAQMNLKIKFICACMRGLRGSPRMLRAPSARGPNSMRPSNQPTTLSSARSWATWRSRQPRSSRS